LPIRRQEALGDDRQKDDVMWFSVAPFIGNTADLANKLSKGRVVVYDKEVDELHVDLNPVEIIALRKEYDVLVLDRHGKDYLMLDEKGSQFKQR
jgi:hypothetical protein